ncbi:DUF1836 domain-containing protein [Cytobacillus pseudoceanisediminis]|uniref:DUF1836 domain-containing protein n=3 Tax=Cytobacillus TaxID=2675230 RepID=A0A160M7E3_9BACI|nr:DUF1836 domain-containing protein [Cytobacillus oceanisediminis]MBY0156584.1 DUF1836 domain-containing protein [Cytobacillus firmus]AND38436.1 hypothetical protein A361_04655 [Cytobacillus oceanisediminis 2691]MCM3391080.1 DUF1836 domain-containing protein [Cytobacillus oceanisediminis]MCM3531046.1 DUF1836 domain-containing protein [Cytobacillus oceanisediminis]OHX46253.1 hypothetical protein BBV17_22380 [Cytobacillus oceanisediminis]
MELFQLSRKSMADFLLSLKGEGGHSPKQILQQAWGAAHEKKGISTEAFLDTKMPAIFEKLLRADLQKIGFSINEIVALGNQIEFTHLSSTAVQNWVKRDVKDLIGSPQLGKKYSADQAAMLFIVEDLKATLDFDSIRKILALLFNDLDDRTDDLIGPIPFYSAYAAIFEKVHQHNGAEKSIYDQTEQCIKKEALKTMESFQDFTENQKDIVSNILVTASLTVLSAYYKSLTKKYVTATLFLNG